MTLSLLSFADTKYASTAERLRCEAQNMNIFQHIFIWNEHNIDTNFVEQHYTFIAQHYFRGFGYWIWKPQILLQALDSLEDNDILLYCDIGCTLNPQGVDRLKEYCDIVQSTPSGILGFHLAFPECQYTKMDTLAYLDFTSEKEIVSPHILSGIFLLRKCEASLRVLHKWKDACLVENHRYIDDSASMLPNVDIFVEHRHDQSLWSILAKQANATTLPDETYFEPDWHLHTHFPVHATRLKY